MIYYQLNRHLTHAPARSSACKCGSEITSIPATHTEVKQNPKTSVYPMPPRTPNRETPAMKITLLALTLLALPLLATACSTKPTPTDSSQSLPAPPGTPAPPVEAASPAVNPTSSPNSNPQPPTPQPPITINPDAGTIDLAATMVSIKPDWLELIATTKGPNSREHEAIVTITAQPSQIHAALLTLGLTPGHPLINKRIGDQFISIPPTGPTVQIFFIYKNHGQTIQTPAHQWVIDKQTGQPLPDSTWLYTGSVFRQWKGKEYYMADEAGNAVSLVNFGDDLLVRQTPTTQNTDGQHLQINEAATPPYGTPLTLRIQVIPPPKAH
jgi:hypothetical protein